ncbi:MAG: rpiA [Chlamydiia bacterium]|nr:rpiA [Chlamydiia bacterium]
MNENEIKKQIAHFAMQFVQDGMTIGLGTGTTSAEFIKCLAEHTFSITCVATSIASEKLALSLGLQCVPLEAVQHIDITFDGADQVDTKKRLIKGAGGALLREKILAAASDQLIVLVDKRKCVNLLGKIKLPVEILPFGNHFTIAHLQKLGYTGALRKRADGSLYVTDNHNFIYDIDLQDERTHPEEDEKKITSVTGVVDTGFFFNLASKIIIGDEQKITVVE